MAAIGVEFLMPQHVVGGDGGDVLTVVI